MSKVPKITDEEERHLIALSEEDGWVSVGMSRIGELTGGTWQKPTLEGDRQRISISFPKRDLARIKTRAAEEGMPYQTLIKSIVHKYVEGR